MFAVCHLFFFRQVSPSMLLSAPKVTAVYPRMVPWPLGKIAVTAVVTLTTPRLDRNGRVPDFEEDQHGDQHGLWKHRACDGWSSKELNSPQDPSLLVVGIGFVNTNRLRCRLIDAAALQKWSDFDLTTNSEMVQYGMNIDRKKTFIQFAIKTYFGSTLGPSNFPVESKSQAGRPIVSPYTMFISSSQARW